MSEENAGTTFEAQCDILSELWMHYRNDDQLKDFVEYNDIGLPLAFLIAEGLVDPRSMGKQMVNETFSLLLAAMEISQDPGFDSLDEILVGE